MIDTKENTYYSIVLCPHNSMLFQAWLHFCVTLSPVPPKHMLLFCLLHCRSLSLLQEFWHLPLGGDMIIRFHLSSAMQLQVHSPCCALHTVHSLWVTAASHGLPLPFPSLHLSFHPTITTSHNPGLLKSAAIKTDAGLKCHKCISNCQNINLFTLSCLAFLRVRRWVERGRVLKGLEQKRRTWQ